MPPIPKNVTRTNKRGQHQIYQPGFNRHNCCWLDGKWITVHPEDWVSESAAHEGMYKNLHAEYKEQSHRDKGISIEEMTPAQRQAWEYDCGLGRFDYVAPNGYYGVAQCKLRKDHEVWPEDLKWIRSKGWKVIRKVKNSHNKKVEDITKAIHFPEDLLTDDTPVDVWKQVVKQNRAAMDEHSRATAKMVVNPPDWAKNPGTLAMMAGVALTGLLEIEEEIIRDEWEVKHTGKHDPFSDPDELKARYVSLRAELEQQFGDQFQGCYDSNKASHNSCARSNLDNSKRYLYCFVLPAFNSDGTHDPWSDNDVPLHDKERKKQKGVNKDKP